MNILIAGANGQIGRQLIQRTARSAHTSRAMIRDSKQADALKALGADTTVVADLEGDLDDAVAGCDAIVFTAGSGGDTGADKTDAVDRDGAIALIDAARKAGVPRFVMVSSMGADHPDDGPEGLRHYLRAKHDADAHLADSGLAYTIVRPGSLSNDAARGTVAAAADLDRRGEVTRGDVAAVLLAAMEADNTRGKTFELLQGDVPVERAVAQL